MIVNQGERLNQFYIHDDATKNFGLADGVVLIDPATGLPYNAAQQEVWDTGTLAWVKMTQPSGGGGGGGNAAAGLTGAAVPTAADYTGYNVGGNLVGVSGSTPLPTTQGLGVQIHDYMALTQASTTDTYTLKLGGSGGATVNTVVVTYTDSSKTVISNVLRT